MKTVTGIFLVIALLAFTAPVYAAEYTDDDAGFSIEYDDSIWMVEGVDEVFGDMEDYDESLLGKPLFLINQDLEMAGIFVIASERDDFEQDFLTFIDESMGGVTVEWVYDSDDIFIDAAGNEFEAVIDVNEVTPEFEDGAILLVQTVFADDIRYEICFLCIRAEFGEAYWDAIDIMDSIEIG